MQRRIRVQPRFWLFVIILLLLSFGVSCGLAQIRYAKVSKHLEALNYEKYLLTEQVSALTERLEYVRTDAYIERVARDELNMLRPGEIRYVAG